MNDRLERNKQAAQASYDAMFHHGDPSCGVLNNDRLQAITS